MLKKISSLWVAVVARQTKQFQSRWGRRLVVSDNFYTRHVLASAILMRTDIEVRMLGTARLNLDNGWNRPVLTESVNRMASVERGT